VYTWWNHAAHQFERNRGMRIDLVLATASVAERVRGAWIDTAERRRPRSSDHAPVVVDVA
jgi:exodeoxyribonuclease-3